MIAPHIYLPIYLTVCYLLVASKIFQTNQLNDGVLNRDYNDSSFKSACIICLFFILFFGLRPILDDEKLSMADTTGYAQVYNWVKDGRIRPYYNYFDTKGVQNEFVFMYIRDFMATSGFPVQAWFTVVAAIYIIPILILTRRWFKGYEYLAILFVITSFGFYGGGINGIRNACANSLFILGMSYLISEKRKFVTIILGLLLCLAAYFTHHSIIIPWLSLVVALFLVKNTKLAIAIWFAAIATSLLMGNTIANWGSALFDDARSSSYLAAGSDSTVMSGFSHTGFRWDFLIYSAMPLLMGGYVLIRKGIIDKTYQTLVNTYILTNAIWIVFIYASYNNRFASLSWSMYPYVLLYPLVRYNIWGTNQAYDTKLILIGQLMFISIF